MIAGAIAFIRANRWAQFAVAGAVGAIAFLIWLAVHDRKVIDAHDTQLDQRAAEQGNEARNEADDNQEIRNETFRHTQDGLANASTPRTYFDELRKSQDRERSKATGR
jgi:hypothetical protein